MSKFIFATVMVGLMGFAFINAAEKPELDGKEYKIRVMSDGYFNSYCAKERPSWEAGELRFTDDKGKLHRIYGGLIIIDEN